MWIQRGGDVNMANKTYGSLLHNADIWSKNYHNVIAFLLKKGILIINKIKKIPIEHPEFA